MKKIVQLALFCHFILATQVLQQDSKKLASIQGTSSSSLLQNRFCEISLPIPHLRFGILIPCENERFFIKPAFGTSIIFHTFELPLCYKIGQSFYIGSSLTLGALPTYFNVADVTVDVGIQFGNKISNNCEWTIRLHFLPSFYSLGDKGIFGITDGQFVGALVNNCFGLSYKF